ncbi:TetR/AcrR family transcriptional regulator [Flexivirga sp. ID2601S]|uniref:TetR/AcrR family transcriptional regulator n=1 Tax=Flexivirga aerilata TaxID=1656889 RepID=A0A849AMQ9_9MICO|nr:TetR/AcrR family transcriptional regulator [Flexivirga aerilata]NNG40776.1 TetR/AcrR family transcriptional regulator [Flexivirga aerilata]
MAKRSSGPTAAAGRGRRAPRVSGDDREAAILATAEKLLESVPFADISIDDLASGAGISRPTFYFYFGSKDDVLLSLLDRLVQRSEEAIAGLTPSEEQVRQGWRDALGVYLDTFAAQRGVALACADARFRNDRVREGWDRAATLWVDNTTAGIEAERARGAAPTGRPARDIAIALNAMNERAIYGTLTGSQPSLPREAVLDVLVDIWMSAIYTSPPTL